MREAHESDLSEILDYLKRNIEDCIYMYIDIKRYGLDNPNMKIWIDFDSNVINLVIMKYHTSISVYTRSDNWDVKATANIIKAENVGSVTATKKIIEQLYEICKDTYKVSYGYVFEFTTYRPMQFDGIIELADEKDTKEIAELIVQDEDIGGYYEVEDLANQLAERMRTHMGRSYVIRDNNKIIAHIASYAELDGIATTGGLVVSQEYQNGIYGAALEGHLVNRLKKENFRIYTFVTARMRKLFLSAMGNPCVGEYGKMVLRKN